MSRLESKLAAKVMMLLAEQDAGKAQLAGALGHWGTKAYPVNSISRFVA
jgi:hypothetical protein